MTDRQNSTDSLRIRQRACKKYERAGRVQDARIRCAARTIYPPRSAASVWAESARSEVLLSMEHADKYRAKRASSDEPKPSRGHEALAIGRLGKVCKLARGRRQMADGATSLVRLRASSGTLRPSMDGRGTSGLRTSVVGLVLTARHNTAEVQCTLITEVAGSPTQPISRRLPLPVLAHSSSSSAPLVRPTALRENACPASCAAH